MSNLVAFNGSLEMRDEAGRTVRYAVVSGEHLQALQAECERLRQQTAAQQQRIRGLEQEAEELRQQQQATAAERDAYWKLCGQIWRDDLERNNDWWEAQIKEGMKSAVDLEDFIRELEAEGGQQPGEKRDVD